MSKVHELKSLPCFFIPLQDGIKTFEVRQNDRDFKAGDVLILKEYRSDILKYTGRQVERLVTYVLKPNEFTGVSESYVIPDDYCIMSLAVSKAESSLKKKSLAACNNKRCAYYNKHYGDSNCKKLEDAIDSLRGVNCDTLISVLKNMQVGCMDNASVDDSKKCITCRYCVPFSNENTQGKCMYNPPVIKAVTGLRGMRPFCMDIEKEYCSKHERRNK